MEKVIIASACRTAIGKFGGTLANVSAAELGSIVIKEAIARAGITPDAVDQVYMGCVIQAGLGQNVARQCSINAGIPVEKPAVGSLVRIIPVAVVVALADLVAAV